MKLELKKAIEGEIVASVKHKARMAFVQDLREETARIVAGQTSTHFRPDSVKYLDLDPFVKDWLMAQDAFYADPGSQSDIVKQEAIMLADSRCYKSNVLIFGETGTGKELLARITHGERSANSFVAINSGGLPRELFESILFGHMKGAYTGAVTEKEGDIVRAHNGTVFLDEIGDMPMDQQVKLLRVIQTGKYTPLGAIGERSIETRWISATNKDIHKLIREGKFRIDLYYRLAQIQLQTIPLRDRISELVGIARLICHRRGWEPPDEEILSNMHFRVGNFRELEAYLMYWQYLGKRPNNYGRMIELYEPESTE